VADGQEQFCEYRYDSVYNVNDQTSDNCGSFYLQCFNVCDTPGLHFEVVRYKYVSEISEDQCTFLELHGDYKATELSCPTSWQAFPDGFPSRDNEDKEICRNLDMGFEWPDCPDFTFTSAGSKPAPEFQRVYEENKDWICGLCDGLATSGPTTGPTSGPTGAPTLGPTAGPIASPTAAPTGGTSSSPTGRPTLSFDAERDDPNWPGETPKPGSSNRLVVNIQYDDYPAEIDWKFEEYGSNGTAAINGSMVEEATPSPSNQSDIDNSTKVPSSDTDTEQEISGATANDFVSMMAAYGSTIGRTSLRDAATWIVMEDYVGADSVGDESRLVSYPIVGLSLETSYRFTIVDIGPDGGDGICCEWGAKGWVTITDGSGVLWELAGDNINNAPSQLNSLSITTAPLV